MLTLKKKEKKKSHIVNILFYFIIIFMSLKSIGMSLTARPWRERLFGRKLLDLSFRLLSEVFGSERFIEL